MTIESQKKRILVAVASTIERDAVLRGLQGADWFDVLLTGVGPAAAAAYTTQTLTAAAYSAQAKSASAYTMQTLTAAAYTAQASSAAAHTARASAACPSTNTDQDDKCDPYHMVVNIGIGGGFPGRAEIGSLAVASTIIAADLGAETLTGFASLEDLGFGTIRFQADPAPSTVLASALKAYGLKVNIGPILTVSTATGTAASAAARNARFPDAIAEGMEGYGVAIAANLAKLPIIEVRAISNMVGPRDRNAWRMGEALQQLEKASTILREVFQ